MVVNVNKENFIKVPSSHVGDLYAEEKPMRQRASPEKEGETETLEALSDMAAAIEELDETSLTQEQRDLIRRLEADGIRLLEQI